jgi:outer membrane protein OmpA-like peptidoglycan-associated protein/tetratricopeptide (TPR) repeat protein
LQSALAQDVKLKRSKNAKIGDAYFKREEYFEASKYYLISIKEDANDIYATYMLAESYRNYFDYLNAERWYLKALKVDSTAFPLHKYWLANMLKINGKYEEADDFFDSFIKHFNPKTPDDKKLLLRAEIEKRGCDLALEQKKFNSNKYAITHLEGPVNTKFSEYAPAICCGDTILALTSMRPGSKGGPVVDKATGTYFSDIYRFLFSKNKWTQIRNQDGFDAINTDRNDGTGQFSPDGQRYYYSSCAEEENECAIYMIQKEGKKWGAPVRLNDLVNMPGFDTKQPSINATEDTLYFASNRPGGLGMTDIWYTFRKKGGDWGNPTNLGPAVNTEYLDVTPFYDSKEHALFFSSSTYGREGFGGLDIYMAYGKGYEHIKNIGLPFNSNRDDFYFTYSQNVAFFTSNREGAIGSDDIFEVQLNKKVSLVNQLAYNMEIEEKKIDIISKLEFKNNQGSSGPAVALLVADDGTILDRVNTDETGTVAFKNLPRNRNYKVALENEGEVKIGEVKYYEDEMETFVPESKRFQELDRKVKFSLAGGDLNIDPKVADAKDVTVHLGDYKSFTFIARLQKPGTQPKNLDVNIPVYLVDEDGTVLKYSQVGNEGVMRFENLSSDKNYRIRVGDKTIDLKSMQNYELADIQVKGSNREASNSLFENVYFDFDSYLLKPEAKSVLDGLIKYYKQYPEIQIEMNANTDSKGSVEYNKKLSEKRGNAALNYLMQGGIPRNALVVNVLGADNPIADNTTEEGRALNRRIEFYVVEAVGF